MELDPSRLIGSKEVQYLELAIVLQAVSCTL